MSNIRKALVVDDRERNRNTARSLLMSLGFEVDLAGDGIEAFEILEKTTTFSLILSDVEMPKMNGFELLERVKRDPRLTTIPFIICTTLGKDSHLEKSKRLGACYYIVKPFDQDQINAALRAAGL